jgi:hypothetical protein
LSTTGKLVGYKKIKVRNNKTGNCEIYILEMEIPAKAKRVFPRGMDGKARAEFVRVSRAWRQYGGGSLKAATGKRTFNHRGFHDARPLTYIIGKIIRPDRFDDNPSNDCSKGINFFLSKATAERYS